ncbi:hypothetical protein SAMN05421770_102287 [Granulicella rosea]|uniref:Uncharacterized protein n=1 Tax=Granulicella rosea TaxID=474952 RepID=A0A239H8X6_9BACT|nr:hypothetical protein [Granulicella rosea]SNS77859.1 hypothetical protein SAMN05421770_102287 [Granulicella rosea]
MKTYSIWITSPPDPVKHFTLHIFPNGGGGARVRETNFTEADVLRQVLSKCLSKDILVNEVIKMADEDGICDLRGREIPLSDECARELGWIE